MKNKEFFWIEGPLAWVLSEARPQKLEEFMTESEGPQLAAAQELGRKLLAIEGQTVAIPFLDEEMSELFLAEGSLIEFSSFELRQGRSHECHANAAELWKRDPQLKLATGYALSSDQCWRRHSWLLENSRIIETTSDRIKYFGVILTDEFAKSFSRFYLEESENDSTG